jgi:hypothetical protein
MDARHAQQENNNEEQNEEEPQEDSGPERNEDGSYNGGVAVPPNEDGQTKTPSECDLMLFLECMETLEDVAPNHSILQPGSVVAIGLDKSTKLSAVFRRFCEFLNEQYPSVQLQRSDFDFFHCDVLKGSDTAEAAALMKNDHIEVRKNRLDQREADAEAYRVQREMDRDYFQHMRLLLPDTIGSKTCDVVLDCRGKLVDEQGLNQEVLRTDVRGHSALLTKRCKWLGGLIKTARDELERQSVVTVPEQENQGADGSARFPPNASMREEEEDDGIEALPYALERNEEEANRSATEIEIDDDDDEDTKMPSVAQRDSAEFFGSSGGGNLLWVTIPNHSPDAVRLLLEYCYTNRVVPLGQQAFLKACRTKDEHRNPLMPFTGPVAPYHSYSSRTRGWPNNGLPLVSFSVALAGIALAEEANMPRLSLMCEVAASELVKPSNVVEALGRCTAQEKQTGNPLALLRKAAMSVLFENGPRGVVEMCRKPTFRRALEEKSASLVPSLLIGTMEAVSPENKTKNPTSPGSKRSLSQATKCAFEEMDRDDSFQRDMERRKRRAERGGNSGGAGDGAFIHEADDWNLETESKVRRSLLKRNPHHGVFQVSRSSPARSRESRPRAARRKKRFRSPDY